MSKTDRHHFLKAYTLKVLLTLLMAVSAGACSDEDVVAERDITDCFNAEGKAWLSLHLPSSSSGTRYPAYGESDTETDIGEAIIFLFRGASGDEEGNTTFTSAYRAKSVKELTPGDNGQVAKQFTFLISRVGLQPKDKLYAFALLNNNPGAVKTDIPLRGGVTEVEFPEENKIATGTKFEDFQKTAISQLTNKENGTEYYLMTSAPMANLPGGKDNPKDAKVTTLEQIPANMIWPTEEEAIQKPAATITVERMAAKIIAEKYVGEMTIADNKNLQILDIEVALDHYNTESYVSRHDAREGIGLKADKVTGGDNENQYRFVEHRKTDDNRYRTYWCKDANYAGNSGLKEYNEGTDFKSITSEGRTFLTHENTFDVEHQSLDCSTQLIVRVKLSNNPFYYIETTGEQIASDSPDPTKEKGTSASSSFARTRADEPELASGMLINYLREWVMKEIPAAKAWVETYAGGKSAFITITAHEPDKNGKVNASVSQSAYSDSSDGYKKFQTETGNIAIGGKTYDIGTDKTLAGYIAEQLNKLVIRKYKTGYCYYRIPIRHFDDDQTPWTLTADMTNGQVATIYGYDVDESGIKTKKLTDASTQNYLGRYGVVRNTCYTVTIDGIKHIGNPEPYESSLADDNPTQFVSLKMSVLPWIQHSQTLE